jgi:prevent-host-death family protein
MCYTLLVQRLVSVRELRNTVSEVLRQVEGGERVTVTVDRRPVAELVPLNRRRAVSLEQARQVVSRHAADRGLLDELKGVLADTTDEL